MQDQNEDKVDENGKKNSIECYNNSYITNIKYFQKLINY